MKLLPLLFCFVLANGLAQPVQNAFQNSFNTAYQLHPEIPRGILEAVSFTQTRFKHLDMFEQPSCAGLPQAYGLMGLIEDGKGYFRNNLTTISQLSGYSKTDIQNNPTTHVLAYASAYKAFMDSFNVSSSIQDHVVVLMALSELPIDHNPVNRFAIDCHLYEIYKFLNNPTYQSSCSFPAYQIDLGQLFGIDNYKILSSSNVTLVDSTVFGPGNTPYTVVDRSAEYGPAIWNPAPSCNYSSRSGTPISAITVHTIQGSYAGAISWSQNCSSNVSYHYVIRSSDGQVTQMVLEANKAWHVGSANPYTIGYEHEGYVSDPSWYTTAMYNSSADLSRDVTQSGYGINPLRTYFGPSSTGTNTLGSCTKIKGHQHYPNQTHTDPGINWDWERYYKLINNNPSVTTQSGASGTIYDSGGPTGNYGDDERELTLITPPGATTLSITFNSFDLELNWDYMYIYDGNTTSAPLIGVYTGTNNPGTINASNGELLLEFRSDCATTNPGWEVSWTSNSTPPGPVDSIPPTATVSTPNGWITQDFTANFTDTDNNGGSGVDKKFVQVIDFDGTEWRANQNEGFFSDNFDAAIHADWSQAVGTWAINASVLRQSDEAESNTNIYTSLNQSNHNQFLYHWAGRISGSGTNKRAGFHFMSDDGSLPNRGNSYFVWLRSDNDKVQIYKVVNDVFTLEVDEPYTVNDNQWYDIKVVYDKTSGDIQVWLDNNYVTDWTDPSPYTSGSFVSFRSGNAVYDVNNLKIYRTRGSSETVTVGSNMMVRYQNPNPSTFSGRVKTISIDSALNVSSINYQDLDVDWTPPNPPSTINDGLASDIDTTYDNTELSANWAGAFDTHSDVVRYWYAIGTSPGATDVVNWTDNWINDTVTHSGLNLTYGVTYYFSVHAENGAGLLSTDVVSDGQILVLPTAPPQASFVLTNSYVCAGDSIQIQNSSTNASTYSWSAPGATLNNSSATNPVVYFPSTGSYDITLTATGPGGTDVETQTFNIIVEQPPVASFTVSDTLVYTPNAFVGFTNTSTNANGYIWDFGDGNASSDVNPWHIYQSSGTYQVMLIAVNNICANDTSYITIVVDGSNGISDEDISDFVVFPNPIQDFLMIGTVKSSSIERIELHDMSGRLIQSYARNQFVGAGEHFSLPVPSSITQGIYTLKIHTNNTTITKRLIKK